MAAGDTTPGRRRPDGTQPHQMIAGDYALTGNTGENAARVWLCLPTGSPGAINDSWSVSVEDDGTITVSPSILQHGDNITPGWHGYLEHGVWREV